MNKIFKVIWDPATGNFRVASETAKSRGKKSGRSKLLVSTLIAASGMLSTFAYADNVAGNPVVPAGHNSGDGWVAIGKNSTASQHTSTDGASTAIGELASALGKYSTSIGARSSAGGDASTALGVNAYASGDRATAMGASADASGNYAMAMGVMAIAKGNYALAFGNESEATGEQSLALGRKALTNEANAIAIGAETEAAENATAVGTQARARGQNSLALGANSNSTGESAVALGYTAEATGANALAFGQNAQALNTNTIALGQSSRASTANAIAIGAGSSAVGSNGLALGSSSYVGGNNSVAIGANSTTDEDNVVSVGSNSQRRRIVNMAAGDISTDSNEAINGSQLYKISRSVADRLGGSAGVASNGTIMGMSYKLKKRDFNNVGEALQYLDNETLHWDSSNGGAFSASYIVKNADGTIASTVAENKIINVKDGVISATSKDAVNGSQLNATKEDVATNTSNIALNTTEIATNTANIQANTTDITNLGDSLTDLQDDALLWDSSANAFSAAHGTGTSSKITNVMDGAVTSASSDAINGSQLHSLSSDIADYFGGNAAVDASGNFTGPTYNIDGTEYSSVGDALDAIDTSVSDSLEDALLWDSSLNAFSAADGTAATNKITNVMAGAVTSVSTDAINGSQLHSLSSDIADYFGGNAAVDASGNFTGPTYNIDGTEYSSVGDALAAIDVSAGGSAGDALMWESTTGEFSASHGGTESVVTDVAKGDISAGSTDAVNGSQLNDTNMLITQIAGDTSAAYIEENGAGVNYIRTNDTGLAFEDASASGVAATAVGYNASASGANSVAIGQNSNSTIDGGIALGSSSVSSRVIVKGSRDTSITGNGAVIGYDTTDGELLGALSIGDDGKYRQIINVADGSEAHDAVTVRQLQNAIGAVTTTPTKYYHANSTAEDSLAVGEDSLAMGAKTVVNGNAGIGIGLNTLVLADAINGIAIGSNARANHANSIAMGNGSQTTRGAQTGYTAYNMDAPQSSVGEFSVGSEDGQRQITNVAAGSQDTDAVNVGQLKVTDERVSQNTQNIAWMENQINGLDTRITNIENGSGSIVVNGDSKYFKANSTGTAASAQGEESVSIGSGSIAAADNSVALGAGSVADEENTISIGSSTNQRRITNVAAGKNATDAVNVAQLKSSEAGGVRYDTKADGSIDYSNITLGGGNGGTTRISNVSAGVNNNDAVNYAQLKQSVQETKQYTDQRMVEMDNKLSKTESKLSGGIASAMAMTGLPQAYTPGASMASIGGGTYNGESAVALGVSMVSANGRWVYKLQGSTNSQGEYSAALGAGIQW
ncbi:TPA: YadA-like family protein [Escherichia coli]|nr:YadA-like family protein [Escherichia coli]